MKQAIEASFSSLSLYGNILPFKKLIEGIFNSLSRRPTVFPISINLLLTRKCNYACRMCVSSKLEKAHGEEKEDVDLPAIKEFIHAVRRHQPVFHIGGGEPFMRKDLLEIVSFIKQSGLKCLVTTNGFLMDEQALKGLKGLVDVLIISLYGPREIHDKVVGVEGAFDKTVDHLKFLVKNKRKDMRVMVSCIAMPESLGSFQTFLAYLQSLGVDAVKIEHLNFLTSKEHAARTVSDSEGNDFDLTPTIFIDDQSFQERFVQELVRLRKEILRFAIPVRIKPYLTDQQIQDWYLSLPQRDHECRFITHSVFVNYNGDIIPCQFLTHCVLGNIKKDSLEDVWHSELYQKLRRTIKKTHLKVCMRCCKN
ncbi:MAG: radical SAM protein [Candidatus Omnitrophota bacterium]